MKVGDVVRLIGEYTITQVWTITGVKSNSKGFWIQIDDGSKVPDVWHKSDNYEVVDESR